jgi:murein DD-endopeptidase MepM/ murein hydrolase activator NlpD
MPIHKLSALGATIVVLLQGAAPAALSPSTEVAWYPQQPEQGILLRLTVAPDTSRIPRADGLAVVGSLAGQTLQFEPLSDGRYQAVAAVPVRSRESLPLTLTMRYEEGDPEHRFIRIPVARAEFPVERLRVARQFVDEPDSALRVRIAAEREAANQVYRRSVETPRIWSGNFARPAAGPITSAFGTERVFNGELQSRHWGVDLDGEQGDPVVAANRGVVALVGDFYYSGNVVYVDHGKGLVTAYLHMSEALVAQGDTVEPGQLVGRIGATGRVTGPHLHWLTRFGRVSVDPMSVLALDLSTFGTPLQPDSVAAP